MSLEVETRLNGKRTPARAGIMAAWHLLGETLIHDIRFTGIYLVGFNLLWVLCSVPIITLPPATAALYVVTQQLAKRQRVSHNDFFRAMLKYAVVSWRWGLLNIAAVLVLWTNFWFFSRLDAAFLNALVLGLGLAWLLIQMYCFPILLEQQQPSVRQALRNALVLCLRHPGFTLMYGVVTVFYVAASLSISYLWVLITAALIAFSYNRALIYLLSVERGEEPPF
jgi:uncharacterized membrane protein YesL